MQGEKAAPRALALPALASIDWLTAGVNTALFPVMPTCAAAGQRQQQDRQQGLPRHASRHAALSATKRARDFISRKNQADWGCLEGVVIRGK